MIETFNEMNPRGFNENTFKMWAEDWTLITAGAPDSYNTMTAAWGGFGVLWNKNVCWCVIRPVRYTYEFMERAECFTLSFFEEKYRGALDLCGNKSGREIDKAAAAGITPIPGKLTGTTAFAEARMILECRKIYFQDLEPGNFIEKEIDAHYPRKDYHRMYFGEIVNCLIK